MRGLILAAVATLTLCATAASAAANGRVVRNGSPAYLKRVEMRAARLPEHVRIARHQCHRYRGWGDQYGSCLLRHGGR